MNTVIRYQIPTRELTFYQLSDVACRFQLLPNLLASGHLLLSPDQYKWLSIDAPLFLHGWEIHWDPSQCYDGSGDPCNYDYDCIMCGLIAENTHAQSTDQDYSEEMLDMIDDQFPSSLKEL